MLLEEYQDLAIMTSRHFIDVRALDVRVKTIEIRELEEQTILNGDANNLFNRI